MRNTWRFTGNELNYLKEVISGDMISSTSGNMNQRFEEAFAKYCGTKYAVTFNSGTSTLHAALHACDVRAGDEVIIPPLNVIASASVILAQGAIPIFADVDENTWNMCPKSAENLITERTKALIPVDLYGLSVDLDKYAEISKKYNVPIINDAAEAFGATCKNRKMDSLADITSYSLENSKHITTGDGGILVTNNEEMAVNMRKFGSLSYSAMKAGDGRIRINKLIFQDPNYSRHDDIGLNYRMPEVAAALGLAQLERIDFFINKRIENASILREALSECDWLKEQKCDEGYKHTQWTFVLRILRDDINWKEFQKRFNSFGGDGPYACWKITYLEDLFTKKAYEKVNRNIYKKIEYKKGLCPISEKIQPRLIQLPTNQGSKEEVIAQRDALHKTINSFS